MPRISADVTRCDGYANCVVVAPDLFGLDDNGKVIAKASQIDEGLKSRAEEAVRNCPVSALSLRD